MGEFTVSPDVAEFNLKVASYLVLVPFADPHG
jgi:hypothetical protein